MLKEPVSNDPNNPLISVLIYNYFGKHLRQCLESIFNQSTLDNIEIILVDSGSADDAWDIALEYAGKYQGIMTIRRKSTHKEKLDHIDQLSLANHREKNDIYDCLRLANGKYVVPLGRDDAFLPEYVKKCVTAMEADPLASFANVKPRKIVSSDWPNVSGEPLVNVLIFNFNYGRYLGQCLDSVFSQTYKNLGIIFSDNASTDDSWNIAVEYERKYPGMMTIIRNRKNFGPATNLRNCYECIDGKYFCVLCSDDALHPDFIQKCVNALEANPESAFTMTHRTIIDEHGAPSYEPPFYNQSCIIPGVEQAAVYMMAAVNPSISQIMYSRSKAFRHLQGDSLVSRWYAQRLLDFELCCHYSMAYINEPLLLNRVHSESDSSQISASLLEAFGQYILPHQFAEMASRGDKMDKAVARLPLALEKLGQLCLRYCTRALLTKDDECALRYFHLSLAIMPAICQDPVYLRIRNYWNADSVEQAKIIAELTHVENLTTRAVSYDPPPGYVPIGAG